MENLKIIKKPLRNSSETTQNLINLGNFQYWPNFFVSYRKIRVHLCSFFIPLEVRGRELFDLRYTCESQVNLSLTFLACIFLKENQTLRASIRKWRRQL